MDEAAETVEILAHGVGIDEQLVDHAGQSRQREIERDRRVGADHPLDRGMRDVALVPQRDVLQRRDDRRAHDAGEAGQVLAQHRVALVRHRRRALLPLARKIPPPPAPRCAADGGFRWPARSTDEATTPSAAKKAAWRSRGITWVETGSGFSPIFSATCASTRGSILAKVPTAPEIAQVAISSRAATSRARARANSA